MRRAPDHLALARTGVRAALPGDRAVDDHRVDAFGGARRRLVGRGIADRGGVEDDDVGMLPDRQRAAALEAEVARGQAGHLPDRGLEREQADVAAVVAEHARERAPQARVRLRPDGDAVRADHRVVEGEDAPHVGLVHQEVDRAAGLQAARRLVLVDAPLARDLVEVAAGVLGMRLARRDQHAAVEHAAVGADHGRAGVVRIAVERDALAAPSPRGCAAG